MTNNFNWFERYIEFMSGSRKEFDNNKDSYYVIELIRRGKDIPNLPSANYHFKNFYINTINDLYKFKDDIIALCDMFKLRAYFSINYKSYKQVLKDTVVECARRVATGDFKKPYAIYESCSGKYLDSKNKMWVVDIDKEDVEEYGTTLDELTLFYKIVIEQECKPNKPIVGELPTRSGRHIICHPFDVKKFNEKLVEKGYKPHSDNNHQIIKKNHLSLLYENL